MVQAATWLLENKPFKDTVAEAAKNAVAIVAVGACACWGGITNASSDVEKDTDYRGVAFKKTDPTKGMLKELGIDKPVINIAGCPAHPDWVLLTLGAVILGKIKIPDDLPAVLDQYNRPKVFFPPDHVVHDNCPRRGYYDRGDVRRAESVDQGACGNWDVKLRTPMQIVEFANGMAQ